MSESQLGESRVAQWEHKRRRMMWREAIAYSVWTATLMMLDANFNIWASALVLVSNLSAAIWLFVVNETKRWQKELAKEPAVERALYDERWDQNRSKALVAAFVAVMSLQAILVVASLLVSTDAKIGAQISIMVGVTGFYLALLYYDRE